MDYSKILGKDDGQRLSFEELVCQLARRGRPESAIEFRRIEGSGVTEGLHMIARWRWDNESTQQTAVVHCLPILPSRGGYGTPRCCIQRLHSGVIASPERHFSVWIGLSYFMLCSWAACWSSWQYKRVVKSLKAVEIPEGYSINSGPTVNVLTAVLGALLMVYLAII